MTLRGENYSENKLSPFDYVQKKNPTVSVLELNMVI
jgi:hypothetical protein